MGLVWYQKRLQEMALTLDPRGYEQGTGKELEDDSGLDQC